MICTSCGNNIPDDSKFCPTCGAACAGTPLSQTSGYQSPEPSLTNSNYDPNLTNGNFGTPAAGGVNHKLYMTLAILETAFCMVILGAVCISKASLIKQCNLRGDYAGAQTAADSCKKWLIATAIVGLVTNALYLFANLR